MSVNEGTQHVVQWNVPYATDKRLYYNENLNSHCHSICNPTNTPFSRLLTYTIHGFDLTILNDMLLHFLSLSHKECNQHQYQLRMSLI